VKILIQHKIQAGFAVSLVILLLTGASAWWSAQRNAETFRAVDHTREVMDAIEGVLVNVLNVQTGVRGFAISGDESFLEPYQTGIDEVRKQFESAKQLTQDNPAQQRRLAVLDPLLQARISRANEVIELRRRGDAAGALQIITTGQGKTAMNEIRRLIAEMEKDERQLLLQRTASAQAATRTMIAIVSFGGVLSLGLVGLASVIVRRDFEKVQEAEEALRSSQQRLTLALEAAQIGDWELNLKTHTARRSLKHDQIFGYPALLPEWTYENFLEHVHPEDRARVDRLFHESVAAGRDWYFECRILRQDGVERHIWARGAMFPDAAGNRTQMVGMVGDITERKRVEDAVRRLNAELAATNQELREAGEALRVNEERFRLMVAGVKDYAIFMLDAEGRVATWNAGAERIKGYAAGEIIGKYFSAFYPPEEVQKGTPESALKTAVAEGHFEEEAWRVRKDGSQFWANVVVTAMRDDAGALRGFSKITRDITARKGAEDAMRQLNRELAAANQELAAFSYSVSHDLRAPLRGIDGFSRVIEEDYGDRLDDTGRSHLARVRAAARRMSELIDDLLKLSQITRAEMHRSPVNLSALAREIAGELQRSEPERQVQWKIADGLSALGDPQLLRVALENLLGNAWKFTGKRTDAAIQFCREERDGQTVFCVRDNGAGFDMAYAKNLFGAFQRMHSVAEFEGTGIGLATVQRVLHRHGGRVWAEAEVDKGAAFRFTVQP
jgi:PAS domain S-box-containing protein